MSATERFPEQPVPDDTVMCDDLDLALDDYIEREGFSLFSIFPADSPREAIVEKNGVFVRLLRKDKSFVPGIGTRDVVISELRESGWHTGRAGMEYRDLIPDRAGGMLIASHIRIPNGGPVPDYVHFHKVDFQVIFCLSGWCGLVYEDQGDPFRFKAGDCVLQPPGIRHRVLDCSDGFEVLELSSPAEHPTYADRTMELPNGSVSPGHLYGGQSFYLFDASVASLPESDEAGFSKLRTGLAEASAGSIGLTVVRSSTRPAPCLDLSENAAAFLFVTKGSMELDPSPAELRQPLTVGSSCFVPAETAVSCTAVSDDLEFLLFEFPSV